MPAGPQDGENILRLQLFGLLVAKRRNVGGLGKGGIHTNNGTTFGEHETLEDYVKQVRDEKA